MIKYNFKQHIDELTSFQTVFGSTYNTEFKELDSETINLRKKLFNEEANEFIENFKIKNDVEILDAIGDMLFLTFGDIVTFGLQEHFLEFNKQVKPNLNIIDTNEGIINFINLLIETIDGGDARTKYFGITSEVTTYSLEIRLMTILSIAEEIYGKDNAVEIVTQALECIYASNMSKLGDDGKPLINGENGVLDGSKPLGKILKSDKFFEPTPKLLELLGNYNVNIGRND